MITRSVICGTELLIYFIKCICIHLDQRYPTCCITHRAHSRFAPSQWETSLLCNDVSHLLGASLESALNSPLSECMFLHLPSWMKVTTVVFINFTWVWTCMAMLSLLVSRGPVLLRLRLASVVSMPSPDTRPALCSEALISSRGDWFNSLTPGRS